ncbi:hypothetical protein GH714_001122 [Hevea brasiliensis]|uniref:NPH3 domain-containing protein n=1 Tax=Hevea brasiliensis TaxID=3981 RepID=A0A6A6LXY4_HEVBR|nr:hypothetical protein GH714_001122 [Hevea brasiliensis]
MSKKKAFSGNTMTLKDFHGGSIPTDLPLPSAPGVIVRSSECSGYDRPNSWGGSMGRPDHRARPNSSPATRHFDDKTPFLSHTTQIGRHFDEDERKPLDGVSAPRRTVGDESFRVPPSKIELKPEPVLSGRVSVSASASGVQFASSYSGRVSDGAYVGASLQNVGGNTGHSVGGSHPNVWAAKKEVVVGVNEPVQSAWSGASAVSKLALASALEKVSSGRWQTKHSIHHQTDDEVIEHLETEKSVACIGHDGYAYNRMDAVGGSEYPDVTLARHVERGMALQDGVQNGKREYVDHEKARVGSYSELRDRNLSMHGERVQQPYTDVRFSRTELLSSVQSESSERPKVKLLPRTKPLENLEPPTVDHKQGYQQLSNSANGHVETSELHGSVNAANSGLANLESEYQVIERPKLNLKSRSQPVEQSEGNTEMGRFALFGGARPREVVLKERGIDNAAIRNHGMGQHPDRETERQQQPQLQQGRPPSPETWRKPVEQPKPASPDATGLRYGKTASALELAQAFSKSFSDPKTADRYSSQRGLHGKTQKVLACFSGRFRKLFGKFTDRARLLKVVFQDFPGGASGFELVASNSSATTNLVDQTEKSLRGINHWTWSELLVALKQCQDLFPAANSSFVLDKVLDSLIGRVALPTVASPFRCSSENFSCQFSSDISSTCSTRNNCSPASWWFEDLLFLNIILLDKVIRMMASQKLDHASIFKFLIFYLKARLLSTGLAEKRQIMEKVISLLLLLDRSCLSCKGLFDVLRIVSSLKRISKCYKIKLERLISSQLDQATLDHLLVPSPPGKHYMYDVNLVLRLAEAYLSQGWMTPSQLKKVGSLMDSYLVEVAPDFLLKPSAFGALVSVLPDSARESSDRLYQAVDLYLEDDFSIEHHQKKLRALKHILRNVSEDDALEDLSMVDAIQRLGIEYLFKEEIGSILQRHSTIHRTYNDNDLHEAALRFRLLRQEGVFKNFKDKGGKFKQKLKYDIKGLLSLYEASQLSTGEDVLDEAEDYSYRLLNSWVTELDHNQARAVENTLEHPHHKSLARFMAKHFIIDFQGENGWMNELQQIAIWDFKRVQSQYQQEIIHISRWWKFVGLSQDMKFARNQPLKWYIWSMAILTDPSWSEQRIELTKLISFIYLIDDIFDVHGTLDELILFTEAVKSEAVEFIDNNPGIISSSATILRLWDDLGSAKDEEQDGHDGSYVECYMKEYKGCSVETARKQVTQMISDAWKQLNQECLFPKSFSSTFSKACLNLARMVPLMYSYDDNQRLPVLEHHVKSLLLTETMSL